AFIQNGKERLMMKRFSVAQTAAVALGALLFTSAGTAVASAASVDDSDVDIAVEITEQSSPGVLALSVAAGSTTLTEVESDDITVREFTGTLPTVTVTDTRTDVPEVPWAVLGTATDFVSGGDTIGGAHLGWSPYLV